MFAEGGGEGGKGHADQDTKKLSEVLRQFSVRYWPVRRQFSTCGEHEWGGEGEELESVKGK